MEKTPEWHKNLAKILRNFENKKNNADAFFTTNIENQDQKIVSIKITNLENISVVEEFEKEVLSLVNTGYNNIIVDMNNISEISEKGIRSLIFAYKLCNKHFGLFKLCDINPSIYEVLSYIHLNSIFDCFINKEAALRSYSN